MHRKYIGLAGLLFAAVFLTGARQTIMGFPIGNVTGVDRKAGVVSVDIGKKDGVLPGMTFLIVTASGQEAARITSSEIYSDMFWSAKMPLYELDKISAGMQARWLLTPEIVALDRAMKADSGDAYRGFLARFPKSRFIAPLLREMPEKKLKEISPDYYAAFKAYTKDSFDKIIRKYPGTGFAQAAADEIKSIDAYEKEQKKIEAERAKRAAEAEAEEKRQEAIEEKIQAQRQMAQQKEYLGKLRNNSSSPVRFVFKSPCEIPSTVVQANSNMDVRSYPGSFEYDVYSVDDASSNQAAQAWQMNQAPSQSFQANQAGQFGQLNQPGQTSVQAGQDSQAGQTAFPGEGTQTSGPQPLKTGTVDVQFDFWEADYP
ncbi:MAG: hypothetical protein M0Z75_10040 [Nitrospiraceae bacterium]|nr:hypothetical protein [Nitrospiraceae bacterium]